MANTTNYNWETPDDTDLVKDGAAAIRTLGNSIDTTTKNLNPETTTGDIAYRSATANTNTRLAIGSTGQVLTVAAGVPSWATPSDQTPLTTKGDVFTFSTVDARLGVGANGTVLTADSAEATGLKWAAPAGGGKVLQVVSATTSTNASTGTATYIDTNLTATITPSSATSKVLVLFHQNGVFRSAAGNTTGVYLRLMRGATEIMVPAQDWAYTNLNQIFLGGTISGAYLDSPATTSATTYKTQFKPGASTFTASVQESSSVSVITLLEIGA
jgi:hypothetical protein